MAVGLRWIFVKVPNVLRISQGIVSVIERARKLDPSPAFPRFTQNRQGTHRASYKLNTSALLPRHGLSVSNLNFLLVDHLVGKERAQALNGRSIEN
jgi:hypothetical protein